MKSLKAGYVVWAGGFLILAIGALNFISYIFEDAKHKSVPERWMIDSAGVIGTILVSAYWGRKWYRFGEKFKKSSSNEKKEKTGTGTR